jgi:hypothetical protein
MDERKDEKAESRTDAGKSTSGESAPAGGAEEAPPAGPAGGPAAPELSGEGRVPLTANRTVLLAVLGVLFIAGIVGGYLFFMTDTFMVAQKEPGETPQEETAVSDLTSIELFFPHEGGLRMEERRVIGYASRSKSATQALMEFLRGPQRGESYVPEGTEVLGVYSGEDGILYIDLSEDFRSNFQGDAMAEFLLLRGLYESVMSNVSGIKGLKVLIGGKEAESVGGHISLPGTLGEAVSQVMLEKR